ncbi:MAG: DUF2157 domain-containing protein [Pasteurellaceae bacterium]|nr:DUF2157 domain-containing protein [Pasteurellaceae bacterium]
MQTFSLFSNWKHYLTLLFSLLGIGLLSSGVVTYLAANWHYFTKFEKLFGTQALLFIVLIAGVYYYHRMKSKAYFSYFSQLAFFLAQVLIGALLALIGQIYQSGADVWQLFALWALLQLPLLLMAPNFAIVILWCVTLNLVLSLNTILHIVLSDMFINLNMYLLFALNIALWALTEWKAKWLRDPYAIASKFCLLMSAVYAG